MHQPVRALAPSPDPRFARETMSRVAANLGRAVMGKQAEVQLAVTCLIAGGHLLVEDVPGVGKTTLAEAMARSFDLGFSRIQFTADLLPADILGVQIFKSQTASFDFRPGPLFQQLILADELNRAPPRTQSALLEAMAQRQVTVDGVTHPLPSPFTVIATQNPSDFSGTYPLPESQLDRFLMRLSLGHPPAEVEAQILRTRAQEDPVRSLAAVCGPMELLALQRLSAAAAVEESVAEYAVHLVANTRRHPEIERGASTRAALALVAAAKAHALWEGRDFVTPGDLKSVLVPTLSHRLVLRGSTHSLSRQDAAHLLEEIGRKLPAPK